MNSSKSYMKDNEDMLNEGQSVDSELSDVGLCTLNKYEYTYNTLLCLLFTGDYQGAYTLATNIIDNASPEYANKMWILRAIITRALGREEDGTSLWL